MIAAVTGSGSVAADQPAVTDEAVQTAIHKAVAWIKAQRNEQGHWETGDNRTDVHWAGNTALALLALLYAGEDPRAEDMDRSLGWLSLQALNGTYTVGTRAHVFALVPRGRFESTLQSDVKWLLDAVGQRGSNAVGAYDYQAPPKGGNPSNWDNSVTQFGVLGIWMAAEAGVAVPESYWELIGEHFITCQRPDGGWDYGQRIPGNSTGSMTAAGLASLFVVLDRRYAERPREAPGLLQSIEAGLSWFGRHYRADTNPGASSDEWKYYYLYGVERVGRASGYKYFRGKDWFREGAAHLLSAQQADGQWPSSGVMDELRNSAFALMFLCHGRAPLLFNKLHHGADWNARLRDVAGLTRYVGHAFERLLNWQIVTLDGSGEDLLDAPALYLYGESPVEFDDVQVQKIREYCQRGGLLFAVEGKRSEPFARSFETLARRAFPEYPLRSLPDEHPLFSGEVSFKIDKPPLMLEVHNGVRTLMLYCGRDLAAAWNRYAGRGKDEEDLRIGANVYLYATDKTTIRSRLQTPTIPQRQTQVQRTIQVARIKHDGGWDVEPFGWNRLANYMNNEAATRLLVTSGLPLDSPGLKQFRVAHMSGARGFTLTREELKGLQRFLSDGGTLIADAGGGSREFLQSLETCLRETLQDEPRALPPDSFIFLGAGLEGAVDLAGTTYRRASRAAGAARKYPLLKAFGSRRRFAVIYSPLDISAGLLGTPIYNVEGYESDSALRIMRNLLLYANLSSADKARLHEGGG